MCKFYINAFKDGYFELVVKYNFNQIYDFFVMTKAKVCTYKCPTYAYVSVAFWLVDISSEFQNWVH